MSILDGTRQWIWGGEVAESPVAASDIALPFYGLATLVLTVASWGVLALRYRRITA